MVDNKLEESVATKHLGITATQTEERTPSNKLNLTILLVIIVFAILGMIFAVVYNRSHQKSEDTTRKYDLSYISGQLESFHHSFSYYPTLKQVNSLSYFSYNSTQAKKNLFKDPSSNNYRLLPGVSPNGYSYIVTPAGCNNMTTTCSHYKLTAILSDNKAFSIEK